MVCNHVFRVELSSRMNPNRIRNRSLPFVLVGALAVFLGNLSFFPTLLRAQEALRYLSQEFARVPLRGTNILSGMGPQKVDGWVNANFGLRSVWRNNGTNDLLRRLVANGFAPMVTQWMQDRSIPVRQSRRNSQRI